MIQVSLSSKSGNGTTTTAIAARPAMRSGALPRSRCNDVMHKKFNGSGIAIYCQPHIGVFPGRPSQLFTRSEGGVGAAGSVLRGAGGEKENRGMRNLDGMVGSFL